MSEPQQALVDKAREAEAAETANLDRVIEAWRRAIAADPAERAPRRELARVLRQAGRWRLLAEALTDEKQRACRSDEERVDVLLEVAAVYRQHLRHDLMTTAALTEALKLAPGNMAILDELQSHYETSKRWADLLVVLSAKAALIAEPAARIELYARIADVHVKRFSNEADGMKALESILELDADHGVARSQLRQLYQKRREWEKFLTIERRRIAGLADPGMRLGEALELARLIQEKLKKPAALIEAWQAVLDVDADNLDALAALATLFERQKQWEDLSQVWTRQAALTSDAGQRVALLHKLGALCADKLGAPDRAIAAYRAVLVVDPDNSRGQEALKKLYLSARAWTDLERIYAAQGKLEEYVTLLERQAELAGDGAPVDLWSTIAVHRLTHLPKGDHGVRAFERVLIADVALAHSAYTQVLEHDPAAGQTLDALASVYQRAERHQELLAICRLRLDWTADEATRRHIHYLIGSTAELAGDDEQALATYQAIVDAAPVEHEAWLALDRIYQRRGQWWELRRVLDGLLACAADGVGPALDTAVMATLHFRLGELLEQHFSDVSAAIEHHRVALELDPMQQGSENALEQLLSSKDHQLTAAAILEPLYERRGEYHKLANVSELLAAHCEEPARRIELEHRVAELYERQLGRLDLAFSALGRALREDPTDPTTLGHLERLADVSGSWEPLVQTLKQVAAGRLDLAKQIDVRCRLGRLYRKLGQPDRSIATYSRVLDLAGDNDEAVLALDGLLEEAGRFEELLPVLRQQRRRVVDDVAALTLDFRIAQLLQKHVGDLPAALELYHQILERDANHAPTLAAMAQVLSDGDQALALWKRLLELRGDDAVTLAALANLYERRQLWAELLDVLERQVRLTSEPAEKLPLLRRAAEVARAIHAWPQLASILEALVGELAGLLSRDVLVTLVTELAELETNTLQRSLPAIEAWSRVLALDPTQLQALGALEVLFAREERWRECIQVLEKQATIAGLDNRQRELELLMRVASMWEVQIGDRAQAILAYTRVLAADPAEPIASAQLEALYREGRDWPRLVEVLEGRAHSMDNASNRVAIWQEVARIYDEEIGDAAAIVRVIRPALERESDLVMEAADLWLKIGARVGSPPEQISAFRAALLADPNCEEAAAALEELYRAQHMTEELLGLLNSMAATTADPAEQVRLLLEIGRLSWQRRDGEQAIEANRNALLIEPESHAALRALEEIYQALGHTEEHSDVLQRLRDLEK